MAPPSKTTNQLQRDLRRAELEVALEETRYQKALLGQLALVEAQAVRDTDIESGRWSLVGGGAEAKALSPGELRDAATMRRQAYKFWRLHPHARGLLRNLVKFIIGREFGTDWADTARGTWDADRTKLTETGDADDPVLVQECWKDFVKRNRFKARAKEYVLRAFRDGEAFLRRFDRSDGRIAVRFVEPERVQSPVGGATRGAVQAGDLDPEEPDLVGRPTEIRDGVEFLAEDVETVVAYHVTNSDGTRSERVPVSQMAHSKPLADSNDLRGFSILEVVMKRLANYDTWEDYRMVLNKVRTAIALVRKVEGTQAQAERIIAGRRPPQSAVAAPPGGLAGRAEPGTGSGRREAAFEPGTILTPGPGVSYEFTSARLDARDASEDGRRFLLGVAAGTGMPEMLITGDWSNSNYASSVESRTPAVREWEDWQEFFEEPFLRVAGWVTAHAKARGLLPPDVDEEVVFQWPPLITRDALRETERSTALFTVGLLSKKTWSAREDLSYEDEQENFREEGEAEGDGDAAAGAAAMALFKKPPGGGGNPGLPASAPAVEALQAAVDTLRADAEAIEDPAARAALTRYVRTLMEVVDAVGHEHAPGGSPGGGQFVSKGGSGGSGDGGVLRLLTAADLIDVKRPPFPRQAFKGFLHDAQNEFIGNVYLHQGRGHVALPASGGRGEIVKALPGDFDPKVFVRAGTTPGGAGRGDITVWRFKSGEPLT